MRSSCPFSSPWPRHLGEVVVLMYVQRTLHRSFAIPVVWHLGDRLEAGKGLEPVAREEPTEIVLGLQMGHLQGSWGYALCKIVVPVVIVVKLWRTK